jgi:hypothetical protein
MAITVKHSKVSTIPDDADTSLVRPSDWNADHTLTGTIPVANGGTGADNTTTAINNLLPSQTGNSGKVLSTDGTNTTWSTNGSGDVVGPASATDNAVARFDTTTGKLIQNSVVTVGDTGAVSGVLSEQFTPTTAPSYSEGLVWYDSTEKALAFYNDSSLQAVHVNQDLIFKVINNTGSTIPNGSPVYVTSTSSGQTYPNVALAKADVAATSSVIGLTNGAIANGAIGYVTSQGTIDNVNTSTFTVGQVLYLSPYSAGQLMNTIPPTGITVQVGVATFINSSTGHIYVKQTTPLAIPASIITGTLGVPNGGTGATTLTGYVKGSGTSALTASATVPTTDLSGTVTNAQLANSAITINGTSTSLGGSVSVGTVTSVAATAGTGISVTGSPITSSGTLTITNTAPDQTVAIASGTGISVTGTYPSFTVTNTSPSSGGTVTSVTATSPVASTGGNTPVISMPAATTSVNGYLTSTDWTTFNNKASTNAATSTVAGLIELNSDTVQTTAANAVTTTASRTYGLQVNAAGQAVINVPWVNSGGTVTSVAALTLGTTGTDLSSTVATGTTTPVITLNVPTASATNRGALSSADWTTFNSKGNGTVTSVTGTAPVVSSGGATPAISMAAATTSVSGYLTSTDWNTFNGKAPATTYTSTYVPYGQGTTTPNQSSSFTFDGTTQNAPIQRASNGIVVNSNTVSTTYSIPSGSNAMSAGPITINSGITVTVASGSRWVVL